MKYLIEEQSQLDKLAREWNTLFEQQTAPVVAVDTEFMRGKTYYAKLCLVQLGIGEHQYCIDVLAIDDVSCLLDLFSDTRIVKLLHAARQDFEVLHQTLQVLPTPVFDTQLAAAFCGRDLQMGYSALVKQRFGITLPQSQARTDWLQRPLSNKQLEYASDDVAHLEALYLGEMEELIELKRLNWYQQELQGFYQTDKYQINPQHAYQRLQAGHLDLLQQHSLKALAQWREEVAQQRDIPRNWVIRDEGMFKLVEKGLSDADDIIASSVFGRKSAVYLAPQVAQVMQFAKVGIEPIWESMKVLTIQDKSHVSELMKHLKQVAKELNIAQGLLATRKDVEWLYRTHSSDKLLSGWRKQVIGDSLLQKAVAMG